MKCHCNKYLPSSFLLESSCICPCHVSFSFSVLCISCLSDQRITNLSSHSVLVFLTQVFVVVGDYFEHLGLLLSLHEKGLLATGNFFVVGVDVEQYDPSQPQKFFRGKRTSFFLCLLKVVIFLTRFSHFYCIRNSQE